MGKEGRTVRRVGRQRWIAAHLRRRIGSIESERKRMARLSASIAIAQASRANEFLERDDSFLDLGRRQHAFLYNGNDLMT